MIKASMLVCATAVALAASGYSHSETPAGDAAAAAQRTQMCAGCHGIPGWRTAFPEVYKVPKLGGQHEGYIVKALQAYKSGERSHPSMRAIAASLTDKDIADLAAYYANTVAKTASK